MPGCRQQLQERHRLSELELMVLDEIVLGGPDLVTRHQLFEKFTAMGISHLTIKDATTKLGAPDRRIIEYRDVPFDPNNPVFVTHDVREEEWWTWPPLGYAPTENLRRFCGANTATELKQNWLG